MATIYVPPPSIEEMLDTFVQWMAHHARAKITVRIDYQDGTHQTTELDYRTTRQEAPNACGEPGLTDTGKD